MPELIPSRKFVEDVEKFRHNSVLRKKIAKALFLLERNPFHPSLHAERILNDPSAWSVRVDRRIRLSFDPREVLPSGMPDWSAGVVLLRVLDHNDLYKHPR